MTTDLHSAVRTAVDEARRLAQAAEERYFIVANLSNAMGGNPNPVTAFSAWWGPARALAMCDWADDVLARHTPRLDPLAVELALPPADHHVCTGCGHSWPCADSRSAAAAFGVETGETP